LGRDFYGKDEEDDYAVVDRPGRMPRNVEEFDLDEDVNEEILRRKQAWAELEKEHDDLKDNMKHMMRKAPEGTEIDNPLRAERVTAQPVEGVYKAP
jgi:hypothetical protein